MQPTSTDYHVVRPCVRMYVYVHNIYMYVCIMYVCMSNFPSMGSDDPPLPLGIENVKIRENS